VKPGVIIEVEDAPDEGDCMIEIPVIQNTSMLHTDLRKRNSTPPSGYNPMKSDGAFDMSPDFKNNGREGYLDINT
jgi:hypothetical protein